ncbi:MAG: T9SS type A sorting domain-containing protein [Bacteroidales bacterium]|nr:T9SS type A sorting domain-containing protein [Bacteroidales bacterium]
MKSVTIGCLILMVGLFSFIQNTSAQVNRAVVDSTFTVCGNCYLCKVRIEDAANAVDGVITSQWKAASEALTIQYDNEVTNSKIVMQAVAAVGHDTELVQAPDDVYAALTGCCLYDRWIDYTFLDIDKNKFYELSVYPNPASEILNVTIPEGSNSVLKLYTLAGKLIKQSQVTQGHNSIGLSDVESGMYLVVIEDNQKTVAVRNLIVK